MDDELRPAIDRLIADGGRLTAHGSTPVGRTIVTLDQPGNRFGILEVRGVVDLDGADPIVQMLLEQGWADPTVTQRLGREVRLRGPEADGRIALARTWRVPPALASEITLEVQTAIGQLDDVELVPLGTRRAADATVVTAPVPIPMAELDELVDTDPRRDPTAGRHQGARTVAAPFRLIGLAVVVLAVAIAWAGLIRGSPRTVVGATPPPSVAAIATLTPTAKATAVPTGTPAPYRSHLISASTEDPSGPAVDAIDGDPVTAWRAAFGIPQWIEIGLDQPATVQQVVLLIAQQEAGTTRHIIEVARAGGAYEVVGVVERMTSDGEAIIFRPTTPLEQVERIRIETMASPSNAGWYEVIIR